ncbi:glycosyltransferase, partial [Candidatus Pacearchaeota archaeon]|nr:glycosyltransferase [Candidatus Pacearchaeota archaeon]
RKFGIAQRQQPIISSIGRMDPLKGHEFLVESAAILNNRGVKAYFLIAGEGPLGQSLKDRVRRLGLDDRVKFVGQVQDIRQIMCVSDIFVLPTISEGCSNVILEAMAAGLAIVTTSIPANKELIENNHSGLLVPTRDPAKMADAIEHLINSPESAKKLGEKAQQKVTNDFSIEDMIAKYEQFYLAIAGMGGLIESS